ncbi:MAG: hypothetical protein IKF99_00695 [Oscillospiraceae bacterium]|nr:hypothetical protein [Oscillospiraceae bacterium]MBR4636264.1 hypothetical protein [Clostridia bacterium]
MQKVDQLHPRLEKQGTAPAAKEDADPGAEDGEERLKDGWKILWYLILWAAAIVSSIFFMKWIWESDLPLWVKALLSK